MKEARYNPQRPPGDPRDGPATYRYGPARLTLSSDRWTPVDEATAQALQDIPGVEIRDAGEVPQETPEAAHSAGDGDSDASGGSSTPPAEEPAPLTAGRRGRRRGGADG